MKKFKLTSEFIVDISGVKLFRIKALIEFGNVKAGDLGGYIEKEENLSHMGDAWVSDDARISGDAQKKPSGWLLVSTDIIIKP